MAMRGPAEGGGGQGPEVGKVLDGRFQVRGTLGAGGMAEVFRVVDGRSGRELALKVLRREVAADPEAVERMRREAELLASIDHPAIVSVEASGTLPDGRVYLAMELLEGETLGQRMRRGPMAPVDLAPVVAGVASGLAAAHGRGVVHRDLKPDNIFLCPGSEDGEPRVKILDFGVSKVFGYERLTRTGQILGTPRYMAPEQLTAERDLDARVDVYALGVILYEALAGQPPIPTNDPTALIVAVLNGQVVPLESMRVGLPEGLPAVVMGAMHRDRDRRPGSIAELAQAFIARSAGRPPAARAGVPTHALGSMEPHDTPRPDATPVPRPGTYSAFGQVAAPGPASDAAGGEPSGVGAAPAADPAGSVATPGDPPEGVAPGEDGDLAVAGLTPRRGLWALVGAVAGILTALSVLWATGGFGWFEDWGADASGDPADGHVEPPSPAPGADDGPVAPPPGEEPGSAPRDEGEATGSEEEEEGEGAQARAAEVPDPTSPASRDAVRAPARREARPRRRPVPPEAAPEATPEATPSPASDAPAATVGEALREARRARAGGDPGRCLTHVERAMELGAPAPVLRLEGDCRWMAGDRDGAVESYRRFCRLVPDHPAIAEVRRRVESADASCP
jgi:eukaryotic-like serine/threonine-protein kinase